MTPIFVQLLTFFRTGKFGPIELGMTKAQVEALLGKPHNWGGDLGCSGKISSNPNAGHTDYLHRPIWAYDDMEFHFGCTHQIYLIFCDHLVWLQQHGKVFELDLWIFDTSREISKGLVMQALDKEGIPYQEKLDKYTGDIILPGDVRLVYDLEDTDEIVAISLLDLQYVQSASSRIVPDDNF